GSWVSFFCFFFSSRRRHTRFSRDWSSDVCSSDLGVLSLALAGRLLHVVAQDAASRASPLEGGRVDALLRGHLAGDTADAPGGGFCRRRGRRRRGSGGSALGGRLPGGRGLAGRPVHLAPLQGRGSLGGRQRLQKGDGF